MKRSVAKENSVNPLFKKEFKDTIDKAGYKNPDIISGGSPRYDEHGKLIDDSKSYHGIGTAYDIRSLTKKSNNQKIIFNKWKKNYSSKEDYELYKKAREHSNGKLEEYISPLIIHKKGEFVKFNDGVTKLEKSHSNHLHVAFKLYGNNTKEVISPELLITIVFVSSLGFILGVFFKMGKDLV